MTVKYTTDHEWIKVEGDIATIGITGYAAEALGELVYVELPTAGDSLNKQDAFAVVESSKSASDVYMPVSGEIIKSNEKLVTAPELVNNSSYEDGWIIKVRMSNPSDLDDTMDEVAYQNLIDNS